jgi:hypothetical protein
MFGSYDVNIASDPPLWVAQDDWDPNVSNVVLLMAGWTFVTGKQCNISAAGSTVTAGLCMGMVDLDSSAAFVESITSTNSVNIINAKISNHKKFNNKNANYNSFNVKNFNINAEPDLNLQFGIMRMRSLVSITWHHSRPRLYH